MRIPKKRNTGPSLDRALSDVDLLAELIQARTDISILLVQLDATLEAEETELEDEDTAVVEQIRAKWANPKWDGSPTPQPLSKAASEKRKQA